MCPADLKVRSAKRIADVRRSPLPGIYAVFSFAVSHRTRELPIRMALGADRGAVLGLVLAEGGCLIAGGLLIVTAAACATVNREPRTHD